MNSIYPWELGVAILIAGVGLFLLHQTICDSVSDVYTHIVFGILELVNEILRVVFIAYVLYRFAVCGIGAFTTCVWAKVKVVLWLGAHLLSPRLLGVGPAATRVWAKAKAPAATLVWASVKASGIANG
jgi:hypothetical protein